ncbi:MAG: hypothetical protein GY757_54625 [bacterium]|nr:hypothetical protein [bacterium]
MPQVSFPYVAEMEFLKDVRNVNGKAKKKKFRDGRIVSPFCFFLKIKEIENAGAILVNFYEVKALDGKKEEKQTGSEAVNHTNPGQAGQTVKHSIPGKGWEAVKLSRPGKGWKRVAQKRFEFGEPGKYYEYIILFDRVEGLPPGKYRYGIFCNEKLIYGNGFEILSSKSRSGHLREIPGHNISVHMYKAFVQI